MSAVQDFPLTSSADMPAHTSNRTRILNILTGVTVIAVLVGVAMSLFYAGRDIEQGDVQRIFYIHMPSFFGAFLAFGGTVLGGINYLRTRQVKWDILALAGVEVGLILSLINLTTGAIWARPIWNTWWTWDPRLTSAAIMALTYAAYLMLRAGIENPDARRRFASVYGIVSMSTVLVTLFIIRVVPDTIHPAAIGPSPQNAEGGFELQGAMAITLIFNLVVWGTLVPIAMMWHRIRLENRAEQINAMKLEVLED
ncbi:MAG: cytochrome c biogenesis protein [Anaerolineae bacterium]